MELCKIQLYFCIHLSNTVGMKNKAIVGPELTPAEAELIRQLRAHPSGKPCGINSPGFNHARDKPPAAPGMTRWRMMLR